MTVESDMNEEEIKAIDELQKRMKSEVDPDLLSDSSLLLKFLKARYMNVDDAETMFRKHLEWRKSFDIENVRKMKKLEVHEKYFPFSHLGYDKEGCLIRYVPLGNIDLRGVMSSCTLKDMHKFVMHEIEWELGMMKKENEKTGKKADKCVYIDNFENFSFAQATDKRILQLVVGLMDIYINNYPERLKAAYFFNTPIYFSLIYSIMKAFLPAEILQKVHVYSDDSYKEDLLKIIDADVLPKFLGGNKTDPDGNELCLSFVDHGGKKVPESYYISKNRQPLSKVPGVQKFILARASFHEITLEVKEPGSYVEWEFETKCRDIGFGLFYQEVVEGEEKITELVPIQRIDTADYPETGTFRCDEAGTYVILFDNTYSWVRAKEVYYRTKVVTPKEHEKEVKI